MKFKGFWKSYLELTKESLKWLKDYWLLFSIFTVIFTIISYVSAFVCVFGWDDFKSLFKKRTDEEDEDFLD